MQNEHTITISPDLSGFGLELALEDAEGNLVKRVHASGWRDTLVWAVLKGCSTFILDIEVEARRDRLAYELRKAGCTVYATVGDYLAESLKQEN